MNEPAGASTSGQAALENADSHGSIVLSGVNLIQGGTLTVFREMIHAVAEAAPDRKIYVLVHRPGLIEEAGVTQLAFPEIRRSWFRRVWFEWVTADSICRSLKATVWISMHDITPRVSAPRQYVYCHNASPFSTIPARQAWKDVRFALFTTFYGLLYRVNIHRNTAVIVQQQWLREEFGRRFATREVIVAHPAGIPPRSGQTGRMSKRITNFLYPTLPSVWKNIELIGRALRLLESDPRWQGRVSVTFDGSESRYAQELVNACSDLRTLHFIGRQPHEKMDACYAHADALLFPSLLESWGLPLSEAKARGLPIVAVDLPYAHETIGNYDRVQLFAPNDEAQLAGLLLDLHSGERSFQPHRMPLPPAPFASDWKSLVSLLLPPGKAASRVCETGDEHGR